MPRCIPPSATPLSLWDIVASGLEALPGVRARNRFRKALSERFQAEHCHLYGSGRAALASLITAFRALSPGRDTVLLPAFTSYSVASAAVSAGAKVAFYDLDPRTLCPDSESFARGLGPDVACAVVCHLFGYPCPMDGLTTMASRYCVPLVDDAAQAFGASVSGRPVAMLGRAGLLSLSRGKNITAVDGGVVLTSDPELSRALDARAPAEPGPRSIPVLFLKALAIWVLQRPGVYWLPRRLPFLNIGASIFDPGFPREGISSFQAALGLRMFARLDAINGRRRRIARDIERLAAKPGRFPAANPDADGVYLRLPCLDQAGREKPELGMVRSYPQALCDLKELKPHLAARDGDFPVARKLARELITLPTHFFVGREETEAVARSMA